MNRLWIGTIRIAVILLLGVGGSLWFSATTPACACTEIYYSAQPILNQLDDQIRDYATVHDGVYPTYAEVNLWYEQRYRQMKADWYGRLPDDEFSQHSFPLYSPWPRRLTNDVNLATGQFQFAPRPEEDGTLGYAVSDDRHVYVLIALENRQHWAALLGPMEMLHPHK